MEPSRRNPYEVHDGLLYFQGAPLPLPKGLILRALAKAGWKGAEGMLDPELGRRLLAADPRIAFALPSRAKAG